MQSPCAVILEPPKIKSLMVSIGKFQDGGGIGQGDHFLPHKFIKRSFECWATSTKQFLNTGRGYQAPRKAAHSFQKQVGQNIKDKERDKRVRDGDLSWGGSLKEKYPLLWDAPNSDVPQNAIIFGNRTFKGEINLKLVD